MTDAARGQVGKSAAEVYEEFFVPALFGQWTGPMLRAAGVGVGERVLDVGCGTGVLARSALETVGETGQVTGLDPNEGMLSVARTIEPRIGWHMGTAEATPFPDSSFDRVLSQFAVMFFTDAAQGMAEMKRVLAPGGTVAVATWASLEQTPGYAAMVGLLSEIVGEEAADALRAPFVLGQCETVQELVGSSFSDFSVATHDGTARFESIAAWVHTDIRGWTLSDMIDDDVYAELLAAAEARLEPFTDDAGRVEFPAPALIATARG